MKKTFFARAMASALALGLLAGCASGGTGSGGDNSGAKAFKLGGTGPLTGDAAVYGIAASNGAKLAVEEIKAAGGSVQFEIQYEDDAHDAEKAVNAYNALKGWGMQISLGSVTSTPGEATSALTFKDRIFALTPSASSPAVTAGKDNMYQMCFTDPNQGVASAQYIKDNNLATKIAIIYKSDEVYSKGIYDAFMAKANELGLEVVSETSFMTGSDTDFNAQLGDAKNKGADFIFLPMYYTPASLILAQASAMGYTPKFFGVDGMDGILTMEGFDSKLAEGVMLLTPFNADSTAEATQNFVAKYKEKYGEAPNQFAADGYDCVYAYMNALEKAGATPDMTAQEICEKLLATFPDFSFDGLTGAGMTWAATGEVNKTPNVVVIQDGKYADMK